MTANAFQTVNIGSGQLLSSAFALGRARDVAVIFPTLDSTAAFVQGGLSQGGAFFRVQSLNPGTGSNAAVIDGLNAFPWGKIEMTASQSAVRSLTILTRT